MNIPVIVRCPRINPALHVPHSPVPTGPVEIGIALDQSGSMSAYSTDVIAGYNVLIEEQKTLSLDTKVSLTLFDSTVKCPYVGKDIALVQPLDNRVYTPDGGTALYDGIIAIVDELAQRVDVLPASPQVVVAILSDGSENASVSCGLIDVRERIVYRQELGWKFLFLGPHASKTAYALGIPVSNALAITASRDGIRQALSKLKSALTNIRLGNSTDVFRLK